MSAGGRRFRWAIGVATVLALESAPALADDITREDQCIDSNGKAQHFRREGKLSAAREQLRTCASSSCPEMVKDDCTKRLDELESVQPTVVFDAKDGSGHDLSAVTVTVDGQPLADKLDGTALRVDPGDHEFAFAVGDQTPVTERLVIKEGEKERRERIVIALASPRTAPSMVPEPSSSGQGGQGLGAQKWVGIVAGGVGVAGIAVGSVFGVLTASAIRKQKTDCASATQCNDHAQAISDHSTWTRDSTVSTAAFIAGGALIVGGLALFFGAHRSSQPPGTTGIVLMPSVAPGGGAFLLDGKF